MFQSFVAFQTCLNISHRALRYRNAFLVNLGDFAHARFDTPIVHASRQTERLVRVLIVDDSAFVRRSLRTLLMTSHEIEVVGAARDGHEGLQLAEELEPDVITLDIEMPTLDGFGKDKPYVTAEDFDKLMGHTSAAYYPDDQNYSAGTFWRALLATAWARG